MFASYDLALHQASPLQDENVFRDSVQRDIKRRRDFGHRGRLACEASQDGAPGRIGNCRENPVQALAATFNHLVEDKPCDACPSRSGV